jgi:hypothetical protein
LPTLSYFYGIVIQLFWDDHPPPHIHASYAGEEAVFQISNSTILRGQMPPRATRFVLEWMEQHRKELMEAWEACSNLKPTKRIAPLS